MAIDSELAFKLSARQQKGKPAPRTERDDGNFLGSGVEYVYLPLLILHLPLGILLYNSSVAAFLHPAIVMTIGLYWAIQKRQPIERVAFVAAYLIGSEVLWRMANAPIFWELGKYGSSLIMIVALFRREHFKIPNSILSYLLFLIPSCFITFAIDDLYWAKDKASFSMSGPICLFASSWFFSHVQLSLPKLKWLMLIITIPLVSVAMTTLFYTLSNPDIEFNTESNLMTSGGFGPNQVSAMLGLGLYATVSAYLLFKNGFKMTVILGILALFFAVQSVLTFSRGGMYAAVGALVIASLFQVDRPGQLIKRLIPVVALAAVFVMVLFPSLDNFTGGKLEERFESVDTTNRADIISSDLDVFWNDPYFGAGVGRSADERYEISQHYALSHTEFSRLLSEHGMLGIFAILSLAIASFFNIKCQKKGIGRALSAGAIAWSCLFMLSAGMRLAAPGFIWGISFVTVVTAAKPSFKAALRRKRVQI